MNKFLFYSIIILGVIFYNTEAYAQRGCCSWHGGVCGCSENGRQVCCDGSLSPSCTCAVSQDRVYGRKETHSATIQIATKVSDSEYCLVWQDVYEKAAMMKGEEQNIAKVRFINQYAECEDLWSVVAEKVSYCYDRGCVLEHLMMSFTWLDISDKINNLYHYLAKKQGRK